MVTLSELFAHTRFPGGWKVVPFLIYLPVGLVVATLRIFIGIQAIVAASLLQKMSAIRSVILRTMCAILGLVVHQENERLRDDSVKVIISNHVSLFDHLAIHLTTGSVSVNVQELPAFFHHAFNYRELLGSVRDKESLVKNVKYFISKESLPVDVQPEEYITSGQKGLLRFSSWPCCLSQPVQPIVLKIWRPPMADVPCSVLSSTWLSDFFWFLFVPFTLVTIKYLPTTQQQENETEEEMTRRIERSIAKELQVEPTQYTSKDVCEYQKRLAVERTPVAKQHTNTKQHYPDPAVVDMATRVKEVLPNVPLSVICTDLAKTKNVDATISNFLEGLIRYTPEASPPPVVSPKATPLKEGKSSLEANLPSTSNDSSVSLDTSAKSFPKNAHERMLSFQERKLRLIECARKRYIEKHALSVINNS